MSNKTAASIRSFLKYLFWTMVAAGATAATSAIANVSIPDWIIPLLGAGLKALATYAATEAGEL
jgi:hypothetical protein